MTTLTINISLLGAAPVLSLPTGARNGSQAYTGTVTTDTAGGTLYWTVTQSATPPAASVIKQGQSQSVPAAGLRSVSGAGLSSETTYYVHYLHARNGLDSAIVTSASFTTEAAGAGSGTVTISVLGRSALQIAPDGVFIRINVADASVAQDNNRDNYDPSFHDVTYLTTWGDTHAVWDKVTNVAASHNNPNLSHGKEVGHVYTRPGTYTITSTAWGPNGLIGSATAQVTVGDPDAVFTGARTILVGSADPAYPGAQVAASLTAARTLSEAMGQTHRVLIRRGSTHTWSSVWAMNQDVTNVYVGAYGTGARPIINSTNGFACFSAIFNGFNDLVVQGLDLRGPWDSQTETGNRSSWAFELFGADQGTNNRAAVIDDCLVDGFGQGVYLPNSSGITKTFIHNTSITGTADYCVFNFQGSSESMCSCTGVVLAHDPLANSGGSGSIAAGNGQGPFRSNRRGRYYFAGCDFFSRQSWTPAGNPWYQACVRFNSAMVPGASGVFERCAFEGGGPVFSHRESEGGGQLRPHVNVLIDKCLVVGSYHTQPLFEIETGGFTIRNCIGVHPQKPTRSGYGHSWVQVISTGPALVSGSVPLKVHNNTFVSDMTAAQGAPVVAHVSGVTSRLSNITNQNNVFVFPRQSGLQPEAPDVSATDLPTIGGVWTSRYLGEKRAGVALNGARATPPGSVDDYRPNAGSPLIGTATGLQSRDDFNGILRTSADRGAVAR